MLARRYRKALARLSDLISQINYRAHCGLSTAVVGRLVLFPGRFVAKAAWEGMREA